MDFSEFLVVLVIGIVLLGPKELPKMLRTAGRWAGKLRHMAANLRAQSGIDEALREGGLEADLREIRALARGELGGLRGELGTLRGEINTLKRNIETEDKHAQATPDEESTATAAPYGSYASDPYKLELQSLEDSVLRDREYPFDGVDSYHVLPESSVLYEELPPSALASDPVYSPNGPQHPTAAPSDAPPAPPPEPEDDNPETQAEGTP